MKLFIQGRDGVVHMIRVDGSTCRMAYRNLARLEITVAQAHVHKLPACGLCWPDQRSYDRYVGRGW